MPHNVANFDDMRTMNPYAPLKESAARPDGLGLTDLERQSAVWQKTVRWLEQELARAQQKLEIHRPEHETEQLRGSVKLCRRLLAAGEAAPLPIMANTLPGAPDF